MVSRKCDYYLLSGVNLYKKLTIFIVALNIRRILILLFIYTFCYLFIIIFKCLYIYLIVYFLCLKIMVIVLE